MMLQFINAKCYYSSFIMKLQDKTCRCKRIWLEKHPKHLCSCYYVALFCQLL